MTEKRAEVLWQDYLFLTKELLKFLEKQDMGMFHDLLDQREKLQALIEDTPDDGFRNSPAGKNLLSEIVKVEQVLGSRFQVVYNKAKHHHQVAEAYNNVHQQPFSKRNWES